MSTLVFGVELSNREPGLVGAGVLSLPLAFSPWQALRRAWPLHNLRERLNGVFAQSLQELALGPDRFPTRRETERAPSLRSTLFCLVPSPGLFYFSSNHSEFGEDWDSLSKG